MIEYKKGDQLDIDISDMGINGEGIGKIDGYTLFVKDAVIGDKAGVSIMKAKKNYAYAHLDEVLIPSNDRVTPVCPKAKSESEVLMRILLTESYGILSVWMIT